MVIIRKKIINNRLYYYLEHSYKVGKKVKKKEKYIGKILPKNINSLKADFMLETRKEKWHSELDKIKKNFSKEWKEMPKVAKKKYIDNFMIKFTYNSNRIEGSTLTLKETAHLLERGIAPKRPVKDINETQSHRVVFYEMLNHKKDLNLNVILHWHKLLFKDTELEIAGQIRKHNVSVAGSKAEFPFPAELNVLLQEFFKWYKKNREDTHPVELAALTHLKFVSIHPFSDGNGRMSRIIMNFVLHKYGFPMLNITYSNRATYYTALERSQVKGIEHIFVQHLIKKYLKEYRDY